jgi:hypothetical protein
MRELPGRRIIPSMTSRPTSSKVLLVSDGRTGVANTPAAAIRRYRIARIRPENRPNMGGSGSEHATR